MSTANWVTLLHFNPSNISGTYIFVVEDDPNAKKEKKKSYGGSKTSRLQPPEHLDPPSSYHTPSSNLGYSPSRNAPSTNYNDNIGTYDSTTYPGYSYQRTPTYADKHKSKPRHKKYGGAKTSYGDIGSGVSYGSNTSRPSGNYESYQNRNYTSPNHTSYSSNPGHYNKYGGSSSTYGGTANARYGGQGHHTDYGRYNTDSAYHKDYGSSGSHPSSAYTPTTLYYQPVASRPYASTNHYQPHYADVKPEPVASRPNQHPVSSATSRNDAYDSKAHISLRKKEDTPEHSVSASIEQKASKYGGKYETSDGKIYYGGKPNKYSSKKSKKYQTRRKTAHADQHHQEKSDRPSV